MITVCLDLEGVIFPEIWINVAEKTGIKELKLTTKDISDYDELMQMRIRILKEKNINIHLIKDVIAALTPLDGAYEFINWLRERFQVIILSDTFYQFAMPLMKQIGYPALFCHNLIIDETGMITGYKLRQKSAKREVVKALKNDLLIKTIALGDSYNDTQMLAEADAGILFSPPQNVIDEFPQFPVANNYEEVKQKFIEASKVIG
ncbi:MAG: bifunctional phosphoserine phosphatase/homoserine phosphotransferase ThrH [Spirochaetes bacterium]|nr:bifunctional phosphoserine phosphatase/homoserine phosphotransferase ThrH [Spirochaetota bacterium]